MGLETLLGNALGWLLKNRFAGFATKAIPVALFVWNVLYIALRHYGAPVEAPQNISFIGYAVGSEAMLVNVGWFGAVGGLFTTALQETAKQMFVHSVSKNVLLQWLAPILVGYSKGKR